MKTHLTWLIPLAGVLAGLNFGGPVGSEAAAALVVQEIDPYVGNQMCLRCHADVQESLTTVPPGSGNAQEIVENGCQNCHGPGRMHVQSPDNTNLRPSVERMTPEQRNQLCSECHGDMPPFNPTHAVAGISCSGCHLFHEPQPDMGVMSWQPNCLSCHAGSQAFDQLHEYDLAGMTTGEISCRSCHRQAHGK